MFLQRPLYQCTSYFGINNDLCLLFALCSAIYFYTFLGFIFLNRPQENEILQLYKHVGYWIQLLLRAGSNLKSHIFFPTKLHSTHSIIIIYYIFFKSPLILAIWLAPGNAILSRIPLFLVPVDNQSRWVFIGFQRLSKVDQQVSSFHNLWTGLTGE